MKTNHKRMDNKENIQSTHKIDQFKGFSTGHSKALSGERKAD